MNITNVKDYLSNTYTPRMSIFGTALRPMAVCADGFKMSIQASDLHYCMPREILRNGDYSNVEIGNLSEEVNEFLPFAEDETKPLYTVYGFVPVEIVNTVIAKHGGIISV